jgi:ankyrin repeat protein
MHPLSWNVYASHVDNVQVLLENGASVNLDFDSIDKQGPVTSLDLVVQLRYITTFQLVENAGGDERFEKIESLLRQHGGKTMKELNEAEL